MRLSKERVVIWLHFYARLLCAHALEGGVGPPLPGTPVEPLVLFCWQKPHWGFESITVRSVGGKWQSTLDKWHILRWNFSGTGCFLFCVFLYQVSVCLFFLIIDIMVVNELTFSGAWPFLSTHLYRWLYITLILPTAVLLWNKLF